MSRSRLPLLCLAIALLGARAGHAALEPGPPEPRLLLDTAGLADDVDPGDVFDAIGDLAFFYLWERDEGETPGLTQLDDDTLRLSLWRTDGSAEGTFPLIAPEASLFYYSDSLDGVLFFALCEAQSPLFLLSPFSCDSPENVRLWRTDGTAEGTFRLLEDPSRFLGFTSFVTRAVPERGLFFFATFADGVGYELWASDGTRAGTRVVRNLTTLGFAQPRRLVSSGGALYFLVRESTSPFATWIGRSDGTPAGTELVRAPFDGGIEILALADGGSRLFLLGRGPDEVVDPPGSIPRRRMTLWSMGDGLELRFLGDLGFPSTRATPLLQAAGGHAFVRFHDGPGETLTLWGSDGTEDGAERLAEVPTGTFLSLFVWLDALGLPGGRGFLALDDPNRGIEPWVTDGTIDGTERLADVCPGGCDSIPRGIGPGAGGSFLFSASDGVHGFEPWSWRPAAGAVEPMGDLCPGECSSGARLVGTVGGRTFLAAEDEAERPVVWAVDPAAGTAALPVADLGGLRIDGFSILFGVFPVEWTVHGESWTFWGADADCPLCLWNLPLSTAPPPPPGPALTSERLPGFAVKVRIGGPEGLAGRAEAACIPETLCVSGALPGRSEVFVRVVGPKPNGRLWPTLVKFSTSTVEVWIEQLATGLLRYYRLEGATPGSSALPGLFDRDGFPPA